MAQPPPIAVRYFVLLAAVALLATAVCSKTEKATSPPPTEPAPVSVQPADTDVPDPVESLDASVAPQTIQQAAEPPPVANPPANAAGKGNSKSNRVDDKTVFPATKSGGMF